MTTVQLACQTVPGFEAFYQKFIRKMTIMDRAESTCRSYGHSLAAMAIHFNRLPTTLSQDEIESYLYLFKQKVEEGSDNYFKFIVYSLRFVFRMEGLNDSNIILPSIKKRRKLPIVLSKEEMSAMLNIPCLLRHRVMIAMLYGCGLRCGEVRNIKVTDIDLDRAVLHVRQSKGKKDRYMPLGNILPGILKNYLRIQKPQNWLFPGKGRDSNSSRFFFDFEHQYGQRSVQWAVKRAAQLAGICKPINVHSLRHTFATHLLEDGVNILTIKELMGHANIKTTMIYLHVAQINNRNKCTPIDKLEGLRLFRGVQMRMEL